MRVGRVRPRARLGMLLAAALLAAAPPGVALSPQRQPVVITFGQPSIWSLEQAHHFLVRLHGQSREPGALDPDAVTGERIEIMKRLLGVEAKFPDPAGSPAAKPSPTPSPGDTPTVTPEDALKSKKDEPPSGGKDPRLNASAQLENFVQMQYEIIARQLTLLRDEIGPGERLVFIELPQTIYYTAPGRGDRKAAQVWWRVSGYTVAEEARPPGGAVKREVRVVGLIPRRSSPAVNDAHETARPGSFDTAPSPLCGSGAESSDRRRREDFAQFARQELNAYGFVKGEKDFGWTFGAPPGAKRVAPGPRTTYALLVIPEEAASLSLKARGCFFPHKKGQPLDHADAGDLSRTRGKLRHAGCGDEQTFTLLVPGGGADDLRVTGIKYGPAEPGERLVALLQGSNFSPQLGVLVNGVPLKRTPGLAQPLPPGGAAGVSPPGAAASDRPTAATPTGRDIEGEFEHLDARQIVIAFRMPKDFRGTPAITLLAPGKAVDLNHLELNVNGRPGVRLMDAPPMFGGEALPAPRAQP